MSGIQFQTDRSVPEKLIGFVILTLNLLNPKSIGFSNMPRSTIMTSFKAILTFIFIKIIYTNIHTHRTRDSAITETMCQQHVILEVK